jgi:hypothetical protein
MDYVWVLLSLFFKPVLDISLHTCVNRIQRCLLQTGGKMMSGNATGGMMKGYITSGNMTSGMMKGKYNLRITNA